MEEKIPVTILTGFLGAGKTTVLNHLIGQYPDKRFAIIENEFGAIGIDQELVVEVDAGIFELSNGCICCTNNGALMDLLWKLLDRHESIDHLLIETTGIAEPDNVAQAFLSEPAIQQAFQLYHTITIVDALFAQETLLERPEAHRQITFADILVINKVDLVETKKIEELTSVLSDLNPFAKMITTTNGQLPKDWLTYQAYKKEVVTRELPLVAARGNAQAHGGIVSVSYTFEEPFDFLKFRHWINVLLLMQGKRIYRVKGILHFAGMEQAMILQTVRQAHVFQKGDDWAERATCQSRLVFIGPGLKREPLEKALRSCLATSS